MHFLLPIATATREESNATVCRSPPTPAFLPQPLPKRSMTSESTQLSGLVGNDGTFHLQTYDQFNSESPPYKFCNSIGYLAFADVVHETMEKSREGTMMCANTIATSASASSTNLLASSLPPPLGWILAGRPKSGINGIRHDITLDNTPAATETGLTMRSIAGVDDESTRSKKRIYVSNSLLLLVTLVRNAVLA